MSQNNTPETYRELLRLLIEFITEPEDEPPEEADAYLRDSGYDPDALVTRMQQRMKKALDTSPLNWRNQTENIQKERNRLTRLTDALSGNVDQLRAEINTLLRSSSAQLALHHRNLNVDDMSETDLAQLLAELRFQLSEQQKSSDENEEE